MIEFFIIIIRKFITYRENITILNYSGEGVKYLLDTIRKLYCFILKFSIFNFPV